MNKNGIKIALLFLLILFGIEDGSLNSADDAFNFDELIQQGQKLLQEHFDENFLESIKGSTDLEEFFNRVQNTFAGEYVIDISELKDAARTVLPILDSYEETKPYADWLRARLEYFDAASELKLLIPPPVQKPGEPLKPYPNPTPELQRKIWQKRVEKIPIPPNAKPYVSKLKPIFLSEGVPQELVWVAEVESGFNPRARSPVGAVGLYQLMPETAKRFGLSTFPVDERKDAEKSARAAAKYLRLLSTRFNDWRLALAAYNAGEGKIQRLLDKEKSKSFDAIATKLPAETQMYVPRIEATILKREGVKLTDLPMISKK